MSMQPSLAAYAGAALLALPLQALPNSDRWHDVHEREHRWERRGDGQRHGHGPDRHSYGPEKRLADKYDRFAGSDRNARELVGGLRNDSEIDLSKGGKTTSFKPATDKMGYGNVDIALGLAKASLAEHGIQNPTPDQIRAALNGGTVTTKSGERVNLPGVLKLRASGMGWGQVAHKIGVKVGDVKGDKHARHHDRDDDRHDHRKKHAHSKPEHKHDAKHDRDHGDRLDHRKQAHHQKPDWKHQRQEHKHEQVKHHQRRPEFHRAKFERPDRVQRPEKVERPHRPERPERPERHHHRR